MCCSGLLVSALRKGRWLHLELGKSAPSFGEFDDANHWPSLALLSDGFGKNQNKAVHASLVPPDERGTRADFWRQYAIDRRTGIASCFHCLK